MGLNLLALGNAVWMPAILTWGSFGLMVIGSDLRGRAEEGLLAGAFGTEYEKYVKKTWRFVPWIY